jgi:hypothetical protein
MYRTRLTHDPKLESWKLRWPNALTWTVLRGWVFALLTIVGVELLFGWLIGKAAGWSPTQCMVMILTGPPCLIVAVYLWFKP